MYKKIKYPYTKHQIIKSDIDFVSKSLTSDFLTGGEYVKKFQNVLSKYVSAKFCSVVNSGTSALHLALLALDIKKGDKIVVPSISFVATANAVKMCGAQVVFCDVNSKNGLIDLSHLKSIIKKNKKIKCVIPVHLNGQSCDMEKIQKICKEENIFIIEDACHALGGYYKNKKVGCCKYSDISTFSFHPAKIITTGEGGALTTNSQNLFDKINLFKSHYVTKIANNFKNLNNGFTDMGQPFEWYYEQHGLGYNYRLSDIQSALGINQLKRIDKIVSKKHDLSNVYQQELKKLSEFLMPIKTQKFNKNAWHLFPVQLNNNYSLSKKNSLIKFLLNFGIQTQVHYIPIHYQPYYNTNLRTLRLKGAENYYINTLSLPMYSELKTVDIKYICKKIENYFL